MLQKFTLQMHHQMNTAAHAHDRTWVHKAGVFMWLYVAINAQVACAVACSTSTHQGALARGMCVSHATTGASLSTCVHSGKNMVVEQVGPLS